MSDLEVWETSVGILPHKVSVMELITRKRVLYLRWRVGGNWKWESLKITLLDEKGQRLTGRKLEAQKKVAIAKAEERYQKLIAGLPDAERRRTAPVTLGEAWKLVSDADTGMYPANTAHRREVQRELSHAARILEPETTFAAITKGDFTKLWRTRIRELRKEIDPTTKLPKRDGLRGAEITVARLLAVASWLRENEKIPPTACISPLKWKKKLREDYPKIAGVDRLPKIARPRHEARQFLQLLAVAWDVDPRFGLMYALGAELRGGQVKRGRRSDLDLPAIDEAAGDFGTFSVPGIGKKGGTKVWLTKGQRAAVERPTR